MKFIPPTSVLLRVILGAFTAPITSAMTMNNMLMSQTLTDFLSQFVTFGDMTLHQKQDILLLADEPDQFNRNDIFATEESKQELRDYLYGEVGSNQLEMEIAEQIASVFMLGEMYPSSSTAELVESLMLNGPSQAVYNTASEGNMVRLGKYTGMVSSTYDRFWHNGIWGYATGSREYALQCHGLGLAIVDVTNPASAYRVQLISMPGGGIWRDAVTYFHAASGKTFAYVGAQGTDGGGTPYAWVVDLSYLSGSTPHGENSNPIPTAGFANIGFQDQGHTINVGRGLLFLNTARSADGCYVYDLTANPWSPKFLFKTGGSSGRDCHDSFVREINGKAILFVSDGSGRREAIYDITNVNANWPVGTRPPQIGLTGQVGGIYAHSCWLSLDNRFLFEFDEANASDMIVHDVSNLSSPVQITQFQYAEETSTNALPHNGEIRGNYLIVAYYEAGLRVFDVSNPYLPVEVGKVETFRDPNGDGTYTDSITGGFKGAWNTYPYLPSGNILVSDMFQGLYIVRANKPYNAPAAASVTTTRNGADDVTLTWSAVADARGYAVSRSLDGMNYFIIAEHLTSTTYFDSTVRTKNAYYKVMAINGEGTSTSSVLSSASILTSSPTRAPTKKPTPAPITLSPTMKPVPPTNPPTSQPTRHCGNGVCESDESSASCPEDCADLGIDGFDVATKASPGVMFKIKAASRDIEVTTFKFNSWQAESAFIQVYSRTGEYKGYELNQNGWELVHEAPINLLGKNTATQLILQNTVVVKSGATKSFFLWVSQATNMGRIAYDAGSSEGAMWRSNNFIELYQGVGVTSQFSGEYAAEVYSPRYFSGMIGFNIVNPSPTPAPTSPPTNNPTNPPTNNPTSFPTTFSPTHNPTNNPTSPPTVKPTTSPSRNPTTDAPTTQSPTLHPVTPEPTKQPTQPPTKSPSVSPTKKPTPVPSTASPTRLPTNKPTPVPSTATPTLNPTNNPTPVPSTATPSKQPTQPPTNKPSVSPTKKPTPVPSTAKPTSFPTNNPTSQPTFACNNDGTCQAQETAITCSRDCANLSLKGTNVGTSGARGIMFEMLSKRDVTVKSFSFYTDASRTGVIEVYTRVGTYQGNELESFGWQLVYSKSVNQQGRDVLTVLGNFDTGVTIPSGSVQSFYIVTSNYIMYNAGSNEGDVLSEDNALVLYQGKGITGSKFPGAGTPDVLWSPRIFKGTIRYDAGASTRRKLLT